MYGGGGITPDIFVAEDTTNVTSYYKQAAMSGLIIQFAFEYTDNNRKTLSQYEDEKELEQYLKRQNTVELFAAYGDSHGLKRRNLMIQKSHKMLEKFINSRIIYNIMSEEAWMMYLNQDDPAIKETLRVFRENKAFPAPPAKEEPSKKAAWRWGISNKA